jgi:nicotinate-nucleotide adenylyltransferase
MERPTYTYNTLSLIRTNISNNYPIFFVLGADSFLSFNNWNNWQELIKLSNFIVIKRQGYSLLNLNKWLEARINLHLFSNFREIAVKPQGEFYLIDFIPFGISSTQIRNYIKGNQDISQWVNSKVINYIKENKLYVN